jgi:hypothetical protein
MIELSEVDRVGAPPTQKSPGVVVATIVAGGVLMVKLLGAVTGNAEDDKATDVGQNPEAKFTLDLATFTPIDKSCATTKY